MRSSVVVCSFLHCHFLSRESWRFCSIFSPPWISVFFFLSGFYPNPNRSFFWITAIGLSMPCSLFPKPFPIRAPLPGTCLMPEWVTSDSFGTRTFAHSPTYIALTNSKDLKEHSIAFSSISTYGAPDEVAAIMSFSADTQTSCPSVTNLIFWCRVDGTAPAIWIYGLPNKQL